MKVDNPNAFRFLLQDEVYLLPGDKADLAATLPTEPVQATVVTPEVVEPVAHKPEPEIATPSIDANKQPKPLIETLPKHFNYLGGNNKSFVVLVNYADSEFIPQAHLTALESILKRKELMLDDVAIFNVNTYTPVAMPKLMEVFKPLKLLIMGKDALPQGIGNLPLNQPVQGKKTHVLYSFSFDEMMSSNENKKVFWDQMKTL